MPIPGEYLTLGGLALLLIAVALFVIPPDYDPAIRIKEWLERRRGE